MSWNKVFIISFAIILISCAKNIIQNTYSYYDDNENLSYLKALYNENNDNTKNAISGYYDLYKKYNDEYYFNQAVILSMKTKDKSLITLVSKHPKNEASVAIETKLDKQNDLSKYQNLKHLSQKYKKEFYLYETLKLCNNSKKSIAGDAAIYKMCQKDKKELTNLKDYVNKKPIFYDLEYKHYSYPLLLKELLEFDMLYDGGKNKSELLKNINLKNLKCSSNLSECLSTLDVLALEKDYDNFFDLADEVRKNLSYDMMNFLNVMKFDAFYFKLLKDDKKVAFRFLKDFYFSYKDINTSKYHENFIKNDLDFKALDLDNATKYNFFYAISLQKYLANGVLDNANIKLDLKNAKFDELKYFLILSDDDSFNSLISKYEPSKLLPKNHIFVSLRSSLNNLYQGNCVKAKDDLKDIKLKVGFDDDYNVMVGEYIFDIDQLQSVLENCIEQKR